MSYEITEKDFLSIVDNPRCNGQEKRNGKAKEGHNNCNSCKGNYFVGGECNYGGCHELITDLQIINQNFRQFDDLLRHKKKLTSSNSEKEFNNQKSFLLSSFQNLKNKCEAEGEEGLLKGSCIGLDDSQQDFAHRIKTTLKRVARGLEYYVEKVKEMN